MDGGASVTPTPRNVELGTFVSFGASGPPSPVRRTSRVRRAIRGATILVADPEDEVRQAICEVMKEENGWSVLEAIAGAEALTIAVTRRPSAIVLAERLQGMSGAEVVLAIRRVGLKIPIVFLTAAREIEDIEESLGVTHHLRKPFGFDQLTAAVVQALGG